MISAIRTAVLVLAALAVHEWAHVLAASYLGARVEKIRPFLLGLSAKITGIERLNAWERHAIYGAGALANGAVAAWAYTVSRLSYVGINWLDQLALFSLALCLFNLLPVLPLDGGRIFQQFLSNRIGVLRANRVMLRLGNILGLALILLGLVQVVLYNYNITLLCAGVYIRKRNKTLEPQLKLEFFRAMQGKSEQERARKMKIKTLQVPYSMPTKDALERLQLDYYIEFHLNEQNSVVTEDALLEYVLANNLCGVVGDVRVKG